MGTQPGANWRHYAKRHFFGSQEETCQLLPSSAQVPKWGVHSP